MTRWALPSSLQGNRGDSFVFRRWDDGEGVVYDDATGSIQIWNPVACDVFELLLSQAPLTEAQITEALLPEVGLAEEDVAMVRRLLLQFQSMGLVECLPT